MKRVLVLAAVLALLVQPGLAFTRTLPAPEYTAPDGGEVVAADDPVAPDPGAAKTFAQEQPEPQAGGMPGWPIPERPVPHHEPGHPSKAADYTTQVTRLNVEGVEEAVQLSGIDAMLADGRMDDPLQGNYRIIEENQILVGALSGGNLGLQTVDVVSNTQLVLDPLDGTQRTLPWLGIRSDVAAGDLNGDGLDEQIAVWLDPYGNRFQSIGEMPVTPERPGVTPAKATSAPAVIARSDGSLDLAVRGYDDALWHIQRDGGGWGEWSNAAGGLLLSGPAIVSPGDGQDSAFVVGADNQVYGAGWEANNRALMFDGVDDYVETEAALTGTGPFAVGAWLKTTATRDQVIIQQRSSSVYDGEYQLRLQPDGTVLWWTYGDSQFGFQVTSSGTVNDGNWHHVAAVREADGTGSIYIDGSPDGSESAPPRTLVSTHVYIGADMRDNLLYFEGSIDEVAIFDRALSEVEVSTIYRSGWDSMSGQVLGLHMDESPASDGTILADASGQGNHGALYTAEGGNNKSIQVPSRWQLIEPKPTDECDWTSLESWHGPTPEVPAPAVIARGSQLDLFRLGPDNTLCRKHYGDGITWGNWEKLGGMLASGPGAVSLGPDHMQVFARGVDGALWYLTYDGGDWEREENEYKWQRLEAPAGIELASRPAAIASGANQVTVYVRGSDDALWQNAYGDGGWGGWESLDGTLDSGPAAVSHDGQIDLFARTEAGLVQNNHYEGGIWGGWVPFGPLGCCVDYYDRPAVDTRFDVRVEAGHFMGAGRELYAIAYVRSDNQHIAVELYGVRDGFRPWLLGSTDLDVGYTTADGSDDFDLAAGDIDGDGLDEIVVASADRYRIGGGGNTVWVNVVDVSCDPEGTGCTMDSYGDPWYHTGPGINEQSGVYVGAGDLDGNGDDEVVVELSAGYYGDYEWGRMVWAVDNNLEDRGESLCHGWGDTCYDFRLPGQTWSTPSFFDDWSASGGVSLGNFIPEPNETIQKAEIAWVSCHSYDWYPSYPSPFPSHVHGCSLHVGELVPASSGHELALIGEYDFGDSMAFAVDSADLNLDLVDEIVAGACVWGLCTSYLFDDFPYDPVSSCVPESTAAIGMANRLALAAGDFMGESVRVGPPSYRVQERVDSVLAVLNMPPKHWDMIKKPDGTYETIQILTEECWTSPKDPKCTHSLHGTIEGASSATTVGTQRDWGICKGTEWKFSNTLLLEGSLERSYSEGFSRTEETITTTTFTRDTTAGYDDAIIYYSNPYKVWEYPVLSDDTGEPARYITVIFPDVNQSNYPDERAGAVCDEGWYAPRHQPYNVWSYDPVGGVRFPDYLGENEILGMTYEGTESEFQVYFENLTGIRRTSSQRHGISRDEGVGFEFSGSAGFNIGVVSASKNFENRFKAYTKSNYNWEDHVTDELQASNATYFSAYFASTPPADHFATKAFAYWSKAGPLVLDYQTEPGTGATWQKYDQPDPAFILPWYGFPDPETLPYPDPNNQGAPPCGAEKQHFSRDVVVDPPFASVGEPVTISATVRNFSRVAANNVVVRFYRGDPANNDGIGEDTILYLDRDTGPETASITSTVAGAGEQKIYAVIDPDDAIVEEMHDEKHIINNNVAYGLLQIGAASYVDMGVADEQPYDALSYGQGGTLTVTLSVPPGNLSAVTRFDVRDVNPEDVLVVGHPFEVVAFQGSDTKMWGEPIESFSLKPGPHDPPAVIAISYADTDIIGKDEANLTLFRRLTSGDIWEEATCPGYQIHRFPEDNLVAVPVCETGTFVLSDEPLAQSVYLPVVFRSH